MIKDRGPASGGITKDTDQCSLVESKLKVPQAVTLRSKCWFYGERETLEAWERPTTTTLLTSSN